MSKILRIADKDGMRCKLAALSIPEPNSGCHLWVGSLANNGYGLVRFGDRLVGAHRISLACKCDELPEGAWALHRCDTRSCVNEDHLFAGSAADNYADMANKGRPRVMPATYRKRVGIEIASRIFRDPRGYDLIAGDFGVSVGTVGNIKRGKCYPGCEKFWE